MVLGKGGGELPAVGLRLLVGHVAERDHQRGVVFDRHPDRELGPRDRTAERAVGPFSDAVETEGMAFGVNALNTAVDADREIGASLPSHGDGAVGGEFHGTAFGLDRAAERFLLGRRQDARLENGLVAGFHILEQRLKRKRFAVADSLGAAGPGRVGGLVRSDFFGDLVAVERIVGRRFVRLPAAGGEGQDEKGRKDQDQNAFHRVCLLM